MMGMLSRDENNFIVERNCGVIRLVSSHAVVITMAFSSRVYILVAHDQHDLFLSHASTL